MKLLYILNLACVLSVGQLFGQTNASIEPVVSATGQKRQYFGVGVGLIANTRSQIIYSPDIQFYPFRKLCVYLGPSFLIPPDQIQFKEKNSYRIGVSYLFKNNNKKINAFTNLEFSRLNYEYISYRFDYAVPNIPLRATILHEQESFGFNLNLGITYNVSKWFFIGGDGGVKLSKDVHHDPSNYYTSDIEENWGASLSVVFALETGIRF